MDDQKADFGTFELALQIDESGKYLDLRTLERKQSGFSVILHAAERTRPLFIAWMFLIPRPPSLFGIQMSFHALRQSALDLGSSFIPVHQKFLMMAVSFAINFLENNMLDM